MDVNETKPVVMQLIPDSAIRHGTAIQRAARESKPNVVAPAIDYRVVPFGKDADAPIHDLIPMHTAMMPRSLPVLLGRRFMEKFYYTILPREGFIQGVVAYVDGKPAGFQVFTLDSDGFMRAAASRHLLRLMWVLVPSLLSNPRRLRYLISAWQLKSSREPGGPPIAEFMSLGVREPFRTREFKEHTGIRVAYDLHAYTFVELQRRGATEARTIVDDDNVRSRKYHEKTGWKLFALDVPGWIVPSVEYRILPEEFRLD